MNDETIIKKLDLLGKLEKKVETLGKANNLPTNKVDILKEHINYDILSGIVRDINMQIQSPKEYALLIEMRAREHRLMYKNLLKEGFTKSQAITLMSAMIIGRGGISAGGCSGCGE